MRAIASYLIDKVAGTTGLEPAASAVTGGNSLAGASSINTLGTRYSATVGVIGQGRTGFVQRFVQRFTFIFQAFAENPSNDGR